MKQVIIILALTATLVLAGCATNSIKTYGTAEPDGPPQTAMEEFAACTAENGATMYGADWCPHCQDQKELFADSFAYVDYVECEEDPQSCQIAGIRGYPTWIINGEFLEGGRSLEEIARKTGCELPA